MVWPVLHGGAGSCAYRAVRRSDLGAGFDSARHRLNRPGTERLKIQHVDSCPFSAVVFPEQECSQIVGMIHTVEYCCAF